LFNNEKSMPGIRIRDASDDGVLAFDLVDLLDVLGDAGQLATWKCSVEDCTLRDGARQDLEAALNAPDGINGSMLSILAADLHQVVDGLFVAFQPGAEVPWITFEAVDSTYWEIITSHPTLLAQFAGRFKSVTPLVWSHGTVDDPAFEAQWCAQARARVAAYLKSEGVDHGRIGDWPAWHVAPYVAVWAIESKARPDWVAWWVISGDLPTDYISAAVIHHPRDAIKAIALRWRQLAHDMAAGQSPEDIRIGTPDDWAALAPLLAARASLLLEWANDDAIWDGLD
jgi:hypothetical protein